LTAERRGLVCGEAFSRDVGELAWMGSSQREAFLSGDGVCDREPSLLDCRDVMISGRDLSLPAGLKKSSLESALLCFLFLVGLPSGVEQISVIRGRGLWKSYELFLFAEKVTTLEFTGGIL
jgi:hypothetical protein